MERRSKSFFKRVIPLNAKEDRRQLLNVLVVQAGSSCLLPLLYGFLEENPEVERHSAEDVNFFSVGDGLTGGGDFADCKEMFKGF